MTRLGHAANRALRSLADRLPRGRTRRILLDAKNTVTASYLEEFRQLFAHDRRFRFYKITRRHQSDEDRAAALDLVGCREIDLRWAGIIHWDLVVLADHPLHEIGDPRRFPVLRISHGIGGKMIDGHDYFYGPRLYTKEGRLRYTRIFEASHQRRSHFVGLHPELDTVVRLVGDLRIDLLQAEARSQPPVAGTRPRVVIASSWSSNNLLESMGRALFDAALPLQDRYEFILRPHPHFFRQDTTDGWKEFLAEQAGRGFTLSPPGEELGHVLATASVVICDDLSSVALYAVALQRPILLCPSGSAQVAPGSFLDRLTSLVPVLRSAADFPRALADVVTRSPVDGLRDLAAEINSRPGQAAALMRQEVYDLLQLTPDSAAGVPAKASPAPSLSLGSCA